ncbi:MAG: SRPBCC family protein [Actinomycetota bacterium]
MTKVISRSTVVAAPAQDIFDLLADPRRHSEIDGSGSVKAAHNDAPARLSLGATFGMDMKIGVGYSMTNTVVEFEENARIAWRHFGGHIWRYLLEPVEGGTKVTEQFDWNTNRAPFMLRVLRAQERNAKSMEQTLQNLKARFGG